jgi:hypothetical protein
MSLSPAASHRIVILSRSEEPALSEVERDLLLGDDLLCAERPSVSGIEARFGRRREILHIRSG